MNPEGGGGLAGFNQRTTMRPQSTSQGMATAAFRHAEPIPFPRVPGLHELLKRGVRNLPAWLAMVPHCETEDNRQWPTTVPTGGKMPQARPYNKGMTCHD
jgi:hypothetical protein